MSPLLRIKLINLFWSLRSPYHPCHRHHRSRLLGPHRSNLMGSCLCCFLNLHNYFSLKNCLNLGYSFNYNCRVSSKLKSSPQVAHAIGVNFSELWSTFKPVSLCPLQNNYLCFDSYFTTQNIQIYLKHWWLILFGNYLPLSYWIGFAAPYPSSWLYWRTQTYLWEGQSLCFGYTCRLIRFYLLGSSFAQCNSFASCLSYLAIMIEEYLLYKINCFSIIRTRQGMELWILLFIRELPLCSLLKLKLSYFRTIG